MSYVPGLSFYAPRLPTHFEPEYADEHQFWSAFGQDQFGSSPVPDNSRVEYAQPIPFFAGQSVSGAVDWMPVYDGAEWANHPNRRVVPAAAQYGLPEFPAMPYSAASHIAKSDAAAATTLNAPFSGWDDTATGADWDSIIRAAPAAAAAADVAMGAGAFARDVQATSQVHYPSGAGAKASLAKLDFALSRLSSLNAQLKAAEAKAAATRSDIAQSNRRIATLNAIRAKLSKLAQQIANLEGRVGSDPLVQAEVVRAISVRPDVAQGFPVLQHW